MLSKEQFVPYQESPFPSLCSVTFIQDPCSSGRNLSLKDSLALTYQRFLFIQILGLHCLCCHSPTVDIVHHASIDRLSKFSVSRLLESFCLPQQLSNICSQVHEQVTSRKCRNLFEHFIYYCFPPVLQFL